MIYAKNLFLYILFAILISITQLIASIHCYAESFDESEAFSSILALNYCHFSLAKILSYNDRIVLDEEYNNIINNINLSKIHDEEILSIIKSLMDTLTKFKLDERSKKKFRKIYEEKVARTLYASIKEGSLGVMDSGKTAFTSALGGAAAGTALSASGAVATTGTMAGIAMAVPVLLPATTASLIALGTTYQSYRDDLDEYQKELDEKIWALNTQAINEINEINKKFLDVYWGLLTKYNASDEWRLSIKQLDDYIDIAKDRNPARQYRRLVRAEHELSVFPPYWYYRCLSAFENNNKVKALEAFEKLIKMRKGFFRKDNIYSSALMIKAQLTDYSNNFDQLVSDMNNIIYNSDHDGRKNLFVSLTYQRYGFLNEAKILIQSNIDEKWNVSLNSRLLANIYSKQKNYQELEDLIIKCLKDDSVRNQDILYMLGKLPNDNSLSSIKKQLLNISFTIKKGLYGADDVILRLPSKWSNDIYGKNFTVEVNGTMHEAKIIKYDNDNEQLVIKLDNVIDIDEIIKNRSEHEQEIVFKLNTISDEISIIGRIIIKDRLVEKGVVDKSVDYTKRLSEKGIKLAKLLLKKDDSEPSLAKENNLKKITVPIYTIEKIVFGDQCYTYENNSIVACPK